MSGDENGVGQPVIDASGRTIRVRLSEPGDGGQVYEFELGWDDHCASLAVTPVLDDPGHQDDVPKLLLSADLLGGGEAAATVEPFYSEAPEYHAVFPLATGDEWHEARKRRVPRGYLDARYPERLIGEDEHALQERLDALPTPDGWQSWPRMPRLSRVWRRGWEDLTIWVDPEAGQIEATRVGVASTERNEVWSLDDKDLAFHNAVSFVAHAADTTAA